MLRDTLRSLQPLGCEGRSGAAEPGGVPRALTDVCPGTAKESQALPLRFSLYLVIRNKLFLQKFGVRSVCLLWRQTQGSQAFGKKGAEGT